MELHESEGKAVASGLSFESFAMRCFLSSAAHGVNGQSPSKPCPTLKNLARGGSVAGFRFGSAGPAVRPAARGFPRCREIDSCHSATRRRCVEV